eukprot:jgi/Botrbrau1/22767/Bobra.0132s0097.1
MTATILQTSVVQLLLIAVCFPPALLAVRDATAGTQPRIPVLSPIPVTPFKAPEAGTPSFASHAAVPTPLSTELPLEDHVAVPGEATARPLRPSELAMTARDSVPSPSELPISYPHATAAPVQELMPQEPAIRTAKCSGNTETVSTSTFADFPGICRVYMFRSSTGTQFESYTGMFVNNTHVVTTGAAVSNGGSKAYNVIAVAGRFGVVCCSATTAAQGPSSCPAANAYNIIRVVTTIGWLNKRQFSNAGAVLKVTRTGPGFFSYQTLQPPSCPISTIYFSYVGLPYPSGTSAGCSTADESMLVFVTATSSVTVTCNYDVPTLPTFTASQLSSCPGTLGSPLIFDPTNNVDLLAAIIVSSDTTCTNGKSSTGFAGFSAGGTSWGFALKSLIAALP